MALRLPCIGINLRLFATVRSGAVAMVLLAGARCVPAQSSQILPESPGAILGLWGASAETSMGQQAGSMPRLPAPQTIPLCDKVNQASVPIGPRAEKSVQGEKRGRPCIQQNPLQPIVSAKDLPALTWQEKGKLAGRDVVDPFNLVTIGAYSAVAIGSNAHTAYGPAWEGFGKLIGYSLLEDMQGEFFGTFAIPSLFHEDPRYHRMPGQPIPKRILHALGHTLVSHHDDGSAMPNYATLLTYPISAELSNLYVPGVAVSGASTAKRVALGLATDPAGALVAEFLPDIAKRIHVRVIFVQQILQQVANGAPSVSNGP